MRLLTPKVTRTGATVAKSKGCAFLEFSTRPALQAALRLHQSELDGRRINVELTAGGGGKGDTRLAKLKARNKELAGQRVGHSHPFARVSPTTYLLLRRRDSRTRRLQEERARRNRRVCNRNVTRRHPGRAMCRTRSAPGQWATKTTAAGIVREKSQKRSAALGQKAGVQE